MGMSAMRAAWRTHWSKFSQCHRQVPASGLDLHFQESEIRLKSAGRDTIRVEASMESDSIKLVGRWQSGDQQAAAELFQRYASRLIALAQQRLSAKLSSRVDPEDVIQSVYCSFFVGARDNRFVLQQSGDLWRLLVGITLHKVHHQVTKHTAQKRSVRKEQSASNGSEQFPFPVEFLAQEPSPEEAVVLAETLQEVLSQFEPVKRKMVEMRLQGHSTADIVAATQRSRATVERVLERLKQQLGDTQT